MAYERLSDSKVTGDSLDVFVDGQMKLYDRQIGVRNAEDELKFMQTVIDQGLDYAAQLAYREDQLTRVSDDKDEKKRVMGEIKALKSLVAQQEYSDQYLQKLVDFEAGMTSVDSVISWLNGVKASATDPDVIAATEKEILARTKDKFTITQNIIQNQTDYALKDKTDSVLSAQISKIKVERNKALLSGNEELTSTYDLQLQALTKAQTENSIDKDIKNFAVATITGNSSAIGLLDSYNKKISKADTNAPVTVNGTTYANAREFWTYTRDSYLSDSGASGFFNRISDETETAIKVKASNNLLTNADVSKMSSTYNDLYSRPELKEYSAKIDAAKQNTIQTAADALSNRISNEYERTLDLNKAVSDLNSLKSQGVNVDTTMQAILNSAATLKSNNISNIVSTAQTLMTDNPGMSAADAVAKAIATGAGAVLSPNELLGQSPQDLSTKTVAAGESGTFSQDLRTTLPGAPSPTANPNPAPGTGGVYTIKAGDTLSAIAAKNGTTVAQLVSLNAIADPNKIRAGATLKLPGAPAPITSVPSTPVTPKGVPSTSPSSIDYTLHANETIAQYNDRIAASRAAASGVKAPAPAATVTTKPKTSTSAPKASTPAPAKTVTLPPIDYTLHNGESIDAYNKRIAAERAKRT